MVDSESTTTVIIGTSEVYLAPEMDARRRAYNAKLCINTLGHATEFDYMMDASTLRNKLLFDDGRDGGRTGVNRAYGVCKGQLIQDYNEITQMRGHTTRMEVACVQNSYVMLGWMAMFGLGHRIEIVAGTAEHHQAGRVPHCWLQDTKTDKILDVASEWYSKHIPQLTMGDEEWEVSIADLFNRSTKTVAPLRSWAEVAATGRSPIIGYGRLKLHLDSLHYYHGGKRNGN